MMPLPLEELSPEDFRGIARMIGTLPSFRVPDRRYTLLEAALTGTSKEATKDTILSQTDLSSDPATAAVELVLALKRFGTVYADQQALGIFLNYILTLLP